MEGRLRKYMDREDTRVKQVTEGILYQLLPTLITTAESKHREEGNSSSQAPYVAVASATLAASCILNAPPGFIEFLLCTPWHQMSVMQAGSDLEALLGVVHITTEQRTEAVNTPIPQYLVPVLSSFMYQECFLSSLPPVFVYTHDERGQKLPSPEAPTAVSASSQPAGQGCAWTPVTRQVAEAALDGATPLHCAALRGNPAQTDHLLYCKANPTLKTSAGLLPLELVPLCGDRDSSGARICRCMHASDAEVWECRSRVTRELLMQRMLSCFSIGASAWLHTLFQVCKCWLGFWGMSKTLQRPAIEAFVQKQELSASEEQRRSARQRLSAVRELSQEGMACLTAAANGVEELLATHATKQGTSTASTEEGGHCNESEVVLCAGNTATQRQNSAESGLPARVATGVAEGSGPQICAAQGALTCAAREQGAEGSLLRAHHENRRPLPCGQGRVLSDLVMMLADTEEAVSMFMDTFENASKAAAMCAQAAEGILGLLFEGFLMRPHQLDQAQRLAASGATTESQQKAGTASVQGNKDAAEPAQASSGAREQAPQAEADISTGGATSGAAPPSQPAQASPPEVELLMPVSEQAEVLTAWAQASLVKLQLCSCTGCAGAALLSVQTCHDLASDLYSSIDTFRSQKNWRREWEAAGRALVQTLQVHVVLLLLTHTDVSPNKARLNAARRCAEQWDDLMADGLTWQLPARDMALAAILKEWVRSAHADITLVEVLAGRPLGPNEDVIAATEASVVVDEQTGQPRLRWPASADFVPSMHQTLQHQPLASARLRALCAAVAEAAQRRVALLERLRSLSTLEVKDSELEATLAALKAAVQELGNLPDVEPERAAAESAREELEQRVAAQQDLEDTMAAVRSISTSDVKSHAALFEVDWEEHRSQLQAAIRSAEARRVNSNRAKRLLREIQAYIAAAAAIKNLDEVMARAPCGAAPLRAAVARLEEASSTLSHPANPVLPFGPSLFAERIAEARARLEVERAAEALAKEVRTMKGVDQLQRLEAAILAAKRVGAEALDPDSYSAASELRERLAHAFRLRSQLELAMRALERGQRKEDADAVEAALLAVAESEGSADLLTDATKAARKSVEQWHALNASDAKLQRMLRDGASTAQLARAIQEASSAGVKVASAKRTLKILQSLEAAVTQQGAGNETSLTTTLQARITAAEAAGICNPLVRTACIRLRTLQATDALASLESALNHQTAAVSVAVQLSTLKAALERSQELLSERRLLQYLSAWHIHLPAPGLAMFAEQASLTEAVEQGAQEKAQDGAQEPGQGGDDTPRTQKGGEPDKQARQRALQSSNMRPIAMEESEAESVLEGVEDCVVAEFGALCDSLLVMVGRALAGVERLDAEVLRIESDKAEAAKQKREAQEREQAARREKEAAERAERDRLEAEKRAEKEAHRARKAAASKVRRAATLTAPNSAPAPAAPPEVPALPSRDAPKMQLGAPAEAMLHEVVAAAMNAGTSTGAVGSGSTTQPHTRRVSSASAASDSAYVKRRSSARQLEMPSAPTPTGRGPQEHTGAEMSSIEASGSVGFMQAMFGTDENMSRRMSANEVLYPSPRYARAVAASASVFPQTQGAPSTPNEATTSLLSYQSATTTPAHSPFTSSFNPPSPASPPLMQRGVMQPISTAGLSRMQPLSYMQQHSASSFSHSGTLAAEGSSLSMHRTSSTGPSLLSAADDSMWRFQQPTSSVAATSDPLSATSLGWGATATTGVAAATSSPQRAPNTVSTHSDSAYMRLHSSLGERPITSGGLGLLQGTAAALWGAPSAQDSSSSLFKRDETQGTSDSLSGGLARHWHLGETSHHGLAGDASSSWMFGLQGPSTHASTGLSDGVTSCLSSNTVPFTSQQPLRSALPASSMHSHGLGKILGDSGSKLGVRDTASSAARPGLFAFGAPGASVFSGGAGASSWGTVDVGNTAADAATASSFSGGMGAAEGQRLMRQDIHFGAPGTRSRETVTARPLGAVGSAIGPTAAPSAIPEIVPSSGSNVQWPEGLLPQHKDSEFNVHAAEFQVRRQPRVSVADLGLPHDLME